MGLAEPSRQEWEWMGGGLGWDDTIFSPQDSIKQSPGLALYLAPGWHKTDMCGLCPVSERGEAEGP